MKNRYSGNYFHQAKIPRAFPKTILYTPDMKHLLSLTTLVLLFAAGTAHAATFPDIQGHRYQQMIEHLSDSIDGYRDGSFRPERTVNRAEFAKIVMRKAYGDAAGQECLSRRGVPFSDVDLRSWYGPWVCVGFDRGILSGYPDGTFRPDRPITYAEAARVLYKGQFTVADNVSLPWWAPAILYLEEIGIALDVSHDHPLRRGELAFLLYHRIGGDQCIVDLNDPTLCRDPSQASRATPRSALSTDACYSVATCERQRSGRCGWTETPEFTECVSVTRERERMYTDIQELGSGPYLCTTDDQCTVAHWEHCGCIQERAVNVSHVDQFLSGSNNAYCRAFCGEPTITMRDTICYEQRCTGLMMSRDRDPARYQEFTEGTFTTVPGTLILFFGHRDDPLSRYYDQLLRSWSRDDALAYTVLRVEYYQYDDTVRRYAIDDKNEFIMLSDNVVFDRREILRRSHKPTEDELRAFLHVR